MEALSDLTGRGATILLYLGLILVLWERCRALKAAFEGRSHSKLLDTTLPIIHSNILLGLLVLGPTTAAFAALREHSCLPLQIDLTDISQTAVLREDWCGRAAKIFNALSYAFTAFAVLATTATAVHARLVYSHWLYLSDKMTEHMSRRIPMLYISDGIITLAYTICTIQANWFTGAVGAVCFDGAKDILDCYIVYCVVSKGKKLDNWAVWKEEAPVVQREIEPQPPRKCRTGFTLLSLNLLKLGGCSSLLVLLAPKLKDCLCALSLVLPYWGFGVERGAISVEHSPLAQRPSIISESTPPASNIMATLSSVPEKAYLAAQYIMLILFAIQMPLSIVSFTRRRRHRWIYGALVAFNLFTFIVCVMAIALSSISSAASREIRSPDVFIGLQGAQTFFGDWAFPPLFLALVLTLDDCQRVLDTTSGVTKPHRLSTAIRLGLFVILLVMGTAAAALSVASQRALLFNALESFADYFRLTDILSKLSYALDALWLLTAFDMLGRSAVIYAKMRRNDVKSKIAKTMLFAIAPLYTLCILIGFIFKLTRILSPNAIDIWMRTSIADAFLQGFFSWGVGMALVVLGLNSTNWNARGKYKATDYPHLPSHRS
ncbi:hypothetical protein BOTBODRAFT_42411 [Botryobasidium botryosum FD-172 SS1]|uniref:Uncharacterized protein n=1 Tax=Botryobasidium botryosum (strain FD-172 SS1) TaxID=930990 RepID=A0A067N1C0_BOTB1|nr:hypothetical protein BOTBODRAFT_42411 [Botryobasidium botryosum FD-172 SS1]